MVIHGYSWLTVVIYSYLWFFMVNHGYLCMKHLCTQAHDNCANKHKTLVKVIKATVKIHSLIP